MLEIKNDIFSLIHITSEKNFKNIFAENKFRISKFSLSPSKIQWLGDGIYFWLCGDEDAISIGKKIVKGKFKKEKCVGIIISVEIEKNQHINLENTIWYQKYVNFLKKTNSDTYNKLINYMEIIRLQENVDETTLNKIGKLTGLTINLFTKYLIEQKHIDIKMVSGCFYHGKRKATPFRKSERMIRQFCIKDDSIVNNNNENWKYNYNI